MTKNEIRNERIGVKNGKKITIYSRGHQYSFR